MSTTATSGSAVTDSSAVTAMVLFCRFTWISCANAPEIMNDRSKQKAKPFMYSPQGGLISTTQKWRTKEGALVSVVFARRGTTIACTRSFRKTNLLNIVKQARGPRIWERGRRGRPAYLVLL